MLIHIAHTAPINPPSATLKLTRAQVWSGLEKKARDPQRFVPAITECEVTDQHATGLTRIVSFKPGAGPSGNLKVKETVDFVKEVRVCLHV